MKKIIALVLVLLVALPMALALTKADITNFGKVPRVSPLATSSPTLNMAKLLGIDKIRAGNLRIPPPPCVQQATAENFDRLVLESSKPVVVDFWAPWCGYCTRFKPTFEQACTEYSDRMSFIGFNTDQDDGIWARFSMRGIPTQIAFNDGVEVARNVGAVTIGVFRGWLNTVLGNL